MHRGERAADGCRSAVSGRDVLGVDLVARQEIGDEGAHVTESGFAEQLGGADAEGVAHAGCQRAQCDRLGGELLFGRRVDGSPHDEGAPVVEFDHRGVAASGALGAEHPGPDDPRPRDRRRRGRG